MAAGLPRMARLPRDPSGRHRIGARNTPPHLQPAAQRPALAAHPGQKAGAREGLSRQAVAGSFPCSGTPLRAGAGRSVLGSLDGLRRLCHQALGNLCALRGSMMDVKA